MSTEDENVPTTVESGDADTKVKSPEKKPAAKSSKSKKTTTKEAKKAATKKPVKATAPAKKKASSSHPTYEEVSSRFDLNFFFFLSNFENFRFQIHNFDIDFVY